MVKLTKKLYYTLFVIMANLYGILELKDVIMIINHYYGDVSSGDIFEQLYFYYEKHKRKPFRVIKTEEEKLYLVSYNFTNKDKAFKMYEIAENSGQEFYLPSLEEFLKYKEDFYFDEDEDKYVTELLYFLLPHFKGEKKLKEQETFIVTIYLHFEIKCSELDGHYKEILDDCDFVFRKKKDVEELDRIFFDLYEHTRLYLYRGFKTCDMKNDDILKFIDNLLCSTELKETLEAEYKDLNKNRKA